LFLNWEDDNERKSSENAYYRYDYSIEGYVKPEVEKYCKDWCFRFNYANGAIKKILEVKKESGQE